MPAKPQVKVKLHPAAELIDLAIARAPALIAAGITWLEIPGKLQLTLKEPAGAVAEVEAPAPVSASHIDPLQDPATYPGGRIPGFTREKES